MILCHLVFEFVGELCQILVFRLELSSLLVKRLYLLNLPHSAQKKTELLEMKITFTTASHIHYAFLAARQNPWQL